jgi:lipopolysaccharide/colanic/teichoic acid biosynthesis glycosyltransferase
MITLRTMVDAVDSKGELLPDAARSTRFDQFLRATRLDEFSAFLNVIKRKMSLVSIVYLES